MAGSEAASELTVLRPPLREADGEQMLAGLRTALSWLEANQQEIKDNQALLKEIIANQQTIIANQEKLLAK